MGFLLSASRPSIAQLLFAHGLANIYSVIQLVCRKGSTKYVVGTIELDSINKYSFLPLSLL